MSRCTPPGFVDQVVGRSEVGRPVPKTAQHRVQATRLRFATQAPEPGRWAASNQKRQFKKSNHTTIPSMNKWSERVFEGLLIELIASIIALATNDALARVLIFGTGTLIAAIICFAPKSTQSQNTDGRKDQISEQEFNGRREVSHQEEESKGLQNLQAKVGEILVGYKQQSTKNKRRIRDKTDTGEKRRKWLINMSAAVVFGVWSCMYFLMLGQASLITPMAIIVLIISIAIFVVAFVRAITL